MARSSGAPTSSASSRTTRPSCNHQGRTAEDVADALSREKLVDRQLSGRSLDKYREGKRAGLPTRDAVVVVEDYLRFLERSGAARDAGDYWTRDPSLRRLIEEQDARESARAKEVAARCRASSALTN